MKALFRILLPVFAGIALLAGCSFPLLPRNIPQTGGNAGLTATAQALLGTAYPAGTSTPGGYPAASPTGGGPAVVTATSAPSSTPAPTNTQAPAATSAPAATATPRPSATTGTTGSSGGIPLPTSRTTIQFPAGTSSYAITTDLGNGSTQAYQIYIVGNPRMYIETDGDVLTQVYGPNLGALTTVLSAINPTPVSTSQSGNYYIALQGKGEVVLSVYIPPANSNASIPAPTPPQLELVQFGPGETSSGFSTNLAPGQVKGYAIAASAGQTMTVNTNGNATVTLLAPDKATLVGTRPAPTHQWIFPLPATGTYTLILLGSGAINGTIEIPELSGNQPSATPQAEATAIPIPANPTRVSFAPGNASATINANLAAGQPQAYVLRVLAGQTLYISTTGSVDITLYSPNNNVLVKGHANNPTRWFGKSGVTGDFTFVISGNGPSTLVFYVQPQ